MFYVCEPYSSFMQRPIHLSFEWVKPNEDGEKYRWTGGDKKGAKNHRYPLKISGCHKCVCSLFQVIKHISTGLYVCELTST